MYFVIVESSGGTDVTWIIVAGIAIASVGVLMVWSVGLTLYCQFVIKRRNFKGQHKKIPEILAISV